MDLDPIDKQIEVPIEFSKLVEGVIDSTESREAIRDLLRRKHAEEELDLCPRIPALLNHNELYLYDHGNGNYSISFRDANIAVLLETLEQGENRTCLSTLFSASQDRSPR